jgi:hypothetical protein
MIGGDGEPHTYLKRGFSAKCAKQYDFLPGSSFTDSVNKITIEVGYVAPDASSAAVTIRRQIPSDQEVCAQTIPYVGGSNDPGYPGYSGGTGSIDACTTCGPGGKTPPKHTQYQ